MHSRDQSSLPAQKKQGHAAGLVQDEVPTPTRLPLFLAIFMVYIVVYCGGVLAAANQGPRHETVH